MDLMFSSAFVPSRQICIILEVARFMIPMHIFLFCELCFHKIFAVCLFFPRPSAVDVDSGGTSVYYRKKRTNRQLLSFIDASPDIDPHGKVPYTHKEKQEEQKREKPGKKKERPTS